MDRVQQNMSTGASEIRFAVCCRASTPCQHQQGQEAEALSIRAGGFPSELRSVKQGKTEIVAGNQGQAYGVERNVGQDSGEREVSQETKVEEEVAA